MRNSFDATRRRTARRALGIAAVLMVAAWVAAWAQSTSELRADLERHFDILILRSGVLLEPRGDESGPRAIEVGPGTIAIDGSTVGVDEVRARLSDEQAELVLRLSRFDRQEFAALAGVVAGEEQSGEVGTETESTTAVVAPTPPAPPAPPAAPAPPTPPAPPAPPSVRHKHRLDKQVVFGSDLTVEEDEISEEVVVFSGNLTVRGKVLGDAAVVGGSADIWGEVDGEVAAVGGNVDVHHTARVEGDVTSVGGEVEVEDGAWVGGHIEEASGPNIRIGPWWRWGGSHWNWEWDRDDTYDLGFRFWRHWWHVGAKALWMVLLALLSCLAILVARNPIARMERQVTAHPWKCGLVGLSASLLFWPLLFVLVVVLAISIIGIPLLFLLPFALLAIAFASLLGFVAVAGRIGEWMEERFGLRLGSPYLAVLAGIAVIGVWSLLGHLLDFGPAPLRVLAFLFWLFGMLLWMAAWLVGFGASILTRFGTGESWGGGGSLPPVPAPPLPSEHELSVPDYGSAAAESEADDWLDEEESGEEPAEDVAGEPTEEP